MLLEMCTKLAEGGHAGGADPLLPAHGRKGCLIWALPAEVGGERGLIDYLGQLEDLIQGCKLGPEGFRGTNHAIAHQRVPQCIFSVEPGPNLPYIQGRRSGSKSGGPASSLNSRRVYLVQVDIELLFDFYWRGLDHFAVRADEARADLDILLHSLRHL